MALTTRLELRHTQSLVMTPQLQQAIKLLQFSSLELQAYVDGELEQNPLLERSEGAPGVEGEGAATPENGALQPEAGEGGTPEAEGGENTPPDSMEMAGRETLPERGDGPLDTDYDGQWDGERDGQSDGQWDGERGMAGESGSAFATWGPGGPADFSTGDSDIEQTLEREKSLRDHLLSQLQMDVTDPADRVIGTHLIDMLDEAGYLAGKLSEVAERLSCDIARVEATLARLQCFDPPGVFARNLAECLALQLKDRNRLDPAMQALLDNLELLGRRDQRTLLRVCGVDAEDLADMVAEIRALDPKPALAFDHQVTQPITPDVLMRRGPRGGWIIELNNDALPRVLVNTRYYAQVSGSVRSKADREYISGCLQSANWLVKALHQRATTILKVASEIVRQQDGFFAKGVQHLRPLILRDIAEAIAMHESTVSRVTTNKFIATPRGTFELKYFFTSSIPASAGGQAHSAEAVRHRIRALIDAEAPKAVLSDDKIVEVLRHGGVDIARRTVAKYREAMRIPSSIQRRREKSCQL